MRYQVSTQDTHHKIEPYFKMKDLPEKWDLDQQDPPEKKDLDWQDLHGKFDFSFRLGFS